MVNMKKIGAIATGALFIGATFGMASAVTVPSGLSSKLASGGVAQAQLVVGADAPGKTADTEAAKEIQEAVKSKLASTIGGDISIDFGSHDLHDNANTADEFNLTTLTANQDAKLYNISQDGFDNQLRYDGNADGDLKDSPDDYTLYSHYYVIDSASGDIQLAYQPTMDSTYNAGNTEGIANAEKGEVIHIKGSKYILTDNVTTDANIEVGPAIVKRLGMTVKDPDNAAVVTGTLKMLYSGDKLVMYDGKSLLNEPNITGKGNYPYKLTSSDKDSDEYSPYDVYVVKISGGTAFIAMVENSQKFKITNDEEGVLGYSKVKVGDSEWNTTNVTFLADTISMVKGDNVDVPDTYYQLKFTTSKGFDILRKKTSAVLSGATVKKATSPGKDFLQTGTKIVLSVVGSDIQIEFGSHDLHDDANTLDEFNQTTLTSNNDAKLYPINQSLTLGDGINYNNALRYDGNADGDLKDDPADYTLYTHYYVVDSGSGDIQLAFRPTLDSTYSNPQDTTIEDLSNVNAGAVMKIKGTKYVITDSDTSDLDIELGPAITKTLGATAKDPDNGIVITGTLKMLYNTSGGDGLLVMYDGNSLLNEPNVTGKEYYKLTSSDKDSSEYAPYDVYVINATSTSAKIAMVEKSQKFKLANDEEGALGYAKIKVNDSDWNTSSVMFLSDTISMVKGDSVDVPDTYYQLKFTTSKGFDILRKKTSTVSSGTTLKSTLAPGKDFLATGNKIVVTATGGASTTDGPELAITDEATADDSMNLVLIGGPVANTLTSDLVENGKSTVDWYASEGDIEVITSGFTSGKYAIIVAGEDRTKTADAAKAVADSL